MILENKYYILRYQYIVFDLGNESHLKNSFLGYIVNLYGWMFFFFFFGGRGEGGGKSVNYRSKLTSQPPLALIPIC